MSPSATKVSSKEGLAASQMSLSERLSAGARLFEERHGKLKSGLRVMARKLTSAWHFSYQQVVPLGNHFGQMESGSSERFFPVYVLEYS